MSRFIEFGEGKAMMVNNAEWLRDLNYIEFIRDIGPYFPSTRCCGRSATNSGWRRA